MNKTYIVGDVHGRSFWKSLIEEMDETDRAIFVGDYLDPYTYYEGISPELAIKVFKEVVDFAKSHSNVTLLLGNHDMSYVASTTVCSCRTDYEHYEEIRDIFRNNIDLFKIACCIESDSQYSDGRSILITHAGVHKKWLECVGCNSSDPHEVAEFLNKKLKDFAESDYDQCDSIIYDMSYISHIRGGHGRYGSCVWADIDEFYYVEKDENAEKIDCYQIFGHTMLSYPEPIVGKNIACVDCKRICDLDEMLHKRTEETNKNNE